MTCAPADVISAPDDGAAVSVGGVRGPSGDRMVTIVIARVLPMPDGE